MPLETFAKRMSQEWREYASADNLIPVDGDSRFPDDMEARNEIIDILSSFSSRDDLGRQILDDAQRNDPEYQQQEYERQQKEDYDQQARDLGYKDYDDMIRQQQQAESRQWMESQKTGSLDYQQTPYFAEGWQGTPDRIQQTGVTEAQHQAIFEQGAKAFQTATERAVSEHRAVTLQDFEQAYRERSGQFFDTDRPYLQRYFNHFRDQANRDYKRRLQADQARARGQEPAEHPERIAAEQRRAEAAEAERIQAEQAAQEAERQAKATTEIPEPDGKTPSLDQAKELDNAQRTASNLGLPVIFTDSDNPIHTQGAADGNTVDKRRRSNAYVFFPEGGGEPRIVINVDRCKDWNDVYLKTLHEGSAHYGLRQMFGKDYDTFLDNVYDAATDELRAGIDQYLNYNPQYKRDSNGQPIKDEEGRDMRDNLADRRQAVDEYLAHLAEKRPQDLTQPERTLWAKIKEWFISLLRQKGFNIKRLTDEDLIDLLRESHRRLLTEQRQRMAEQGEAPADRTQVLRTGEPNAPAVGETPAEGEGVNRFGSRVNKRMADISSKLAGMEMDENQRKVVDVFTGKSDNESITVQRIDGSTARIIMRKGNEAKGGTKHSLFRHYGTTISPFKAEDILVIPEILSSGEKTTRTEKGKLVNEYQLQDEEGNTYHVITSDDSGREAFITFYKSNEVSSVARPTHSEEARAATDNTSSTGKVTQNSPTDQTNPQKSATGRGKNSYSLPSDTTSEERKAYDGDRDAEYQKAVEQGDWEKVDMMLREEARLRGYSPDTSYQGSIAFNGAAPSKNVYFDTRGQRKQAFNNGDFEGDYSLGDFAEAGLDNHDLEWQLTHPIQASGRDTATMESIRNINKALNSGKRTIKIYRAVDADIKENAFRNGDWVTPSREYAERHIGLQEWKKGRIIEQEVPFDDLWWNGDDINEWGYDDGRQYAYKNTPNNRKLLEPTYDDNGKLIPLSQRFNPTNGDTRYSLSSFNPLEQVHTNIERRKIERAEQETDTEPTDAQKEAGNYKKGHVKIDGYDLTIEQPKGSVRRGTDASGKQWEQVMRNTYGYIRGTEGVDGDHIDVYLSDDPSHGDVFVVDQVNKDGSFDEHKVMYGFPDIESARKAYLSNYEDGWTGLGAITPVSKEQFKNWIRSSHRKTKPFAEYSSVKTLSVKEEQGTDRYSLPLQLTIDFHEDATAAPSNLSDPSDLSDPSAPSDPSYNPSATRKGRQMPPSMLTDEELLLRTRTEEGSTDDWNLYNDEYDRRHRQEYADLTDHYRAILEQTQPTLDDAYAMLAAADQHFHYGGHARPERTELLAQRHTLQNYIDRKEAVFQIQKTNITE